MNNDTFIRTESSALINTDNAAYKAARLRTKKETEFKQLLSKVDKLEQCVENLQSRIEEIEKNANN